MLHFPHDARNDENTGAGHAEADDLISLGTFLAAVRRQIWVVAGGAVAGIVLGILYLIYATPLYTSGIEIYIDHSSPTVFEDMSSSPSQQQTDEDVLSQAQVLGSRHLAMTVVSNLDLVHNQEFMQGTTSLSQKILGTVIGSIKMALQYVIPQPDQRSVRPDQREDLKRAAVGQIRSNLNVDRVGDTYIISLSYTAATPELANQIADAYGKAYVEDQLQTKYDVARQASDWLQTRIKKLRKQSYDADLAVQQFRASNGLIMSGDKLVSEQQLSELTTKLTEARAATAEAKARLDHINTILTNKQTDAVVDDTFDSDTIAKLHGKYLDAARREAEISRKLGPDQPQAVSLRADMKEYRDLIFKEFGRIAQSYQSDYTIAMSRQKSLEDSMHKLLNVNANADKTAVKLRQLERQADAYKALYSSFLQKYQQSVQQESFPVTRARVISPATMPLEPSSPRKLLDLALFLVLGAAAGTGVAAGREYRDSFFRSGEQIRSELGIEFLGFVPAVSGKAAALHRTSIGSRLWKSSSLNCYVCDHPLSPFAETLRNVKLAADIALSEPRPKVLGIISCISSEGKSTISANLAGMLAMQGARVLLIDADLRNADLSRSLATRSDAGLVEALVEERPSDSLLQWDEGGRLAVLPAMVNKIIPHSSSLLGSARMGQLLDSFGTTFDYLVVDLPPIGPIVDAKAFARHADAFVFVAEWGRISRPMAREIIGRSPIIQSKCIGGILNKLDDRKMNLYKAHGSIRHYTAEYASRYFS